MSNAKPAKKKTDCDLILEVASIDFIEAENRLLEEPRLLTLKDKNSRLVLHWAAVMGKERLVKLLLDIGVANIDDEDDSGATPLLLATLKGSITICLLLLDNEANVNHQNKNGHNAVKYAGSKNHKDVLQLLLERGGDPNARDNIGDTALHRVASMEHTECLRMILDNTVVPVQINAQNSQGNTALHLACENVDTSCAILLIDRGANAEILNKDEETPLDVSKPNMRRIFREKLAVRDGPSGNE